VNCIAAGATNYEHVNTDRNEGEISLYVRKFGRDQVLNVYTVHNGKFTYKYVVESVRINSNTEKKKSSS
jgi:hypothetical protein